MLNLNYHEENKDILQDQIKVEMESTLKNNLFPTSKSEPVQDTIVDLGPTKRNVVPGDIRGGFRIENTKKNL